MNSGDVQPSAYDAGASSVPQKNEQHSSHTQELYGYLAAIQPEQKILFLFDVLMGNIPLLSQHPPSPPDEATIEMRNAHLFSDFMINLVGKNIPAEQYQRLWLEVWINRGVDAFQHYLSRILLRMYTNRPEMLNSSEQKLSVPEESIKAQAELQVLKLMYKGFSQLIKHLNQNLRVGFDINFPDYKPVCEVIEVRNIIVHNRGRVSKKFLKNLPDKGNEGYKVGDLYPLDLKYALNRDNSLQRLASELDTRIVKYFNLRTLF